MWSRSINVLVILGIMVRRILLYLSFCIEHYVVFEFGCCSFVHDDAHELVCMWYFTQNFLDLLFGLYSGS